MCSNIILQTEKFRKDRDLFLALCGAEKSRIKGTPLVKTLLTA